MKAMGKKETYMLQLPYLITNMRSDIKDDDITSVIDFCTQESRLTKIFHEFTHNSGIQYNDTV